MVLKNKRIGVAMTGSFCTYTKAFEQINRLLEEGAILQTIFSDISQHIKCRFGKGEEFVKRAHDMTGNEPMKTIEEAEIIGPTGCMASNDALGMNLKNIGNLLNHKHIYFVPFGQDDPVKKPNSMIADTRLLIPTILQALKGRQYQPVLIDHKK